MKDCLEEERQKQGFETWTASKKSRRKQKTTNRVVPEEYGHEKELSATDIPQPIPHSSGKNTNIVRPPQKEKSGRKCEVGTIRRSEPQGSIVISEKEYRLLLSLKQKSTAVVIGITHDEKNAASKVGDDGAHSKDRRTDVELGQRLKKHVGSPTALVNDTGLCGNKLTLQKNKDDNLEGTSPTDYEEHGEGSQRKGKQKKGASPNALEEHASDSDFQSIPERRRGSGHIVGSLVQHRQQNASMKAVGGNENVYGRVQGLCSVERRGNGSDENPLHLPWKELPPRKTGLPGLLMEHKSAEDTDSEWNEGPSQKKVFFPFEKVETVFDSDLQGVGASTQYDSNSDGDDDFQERAPHTRGKGELVMKPVFTESDARANRKRKKADRDLAMQKREARGKKPFYIMVNAMGYPYGDGLAAWRAEVNKLSRALDPSIRDIRQQPHQKIEILKKRLTDKFDYSGVISDKYLLPLLGQKVSGRRNELMNAIRARRDRPSGVDKDAWRRLECISKSPNFERKSAAMRYANACRNNVGRTGPGGEIGVCDSLKEVLRRSPDPEEVQAEMTRDKGYRGKKRKTKDVAVHGKKQAEDRELITRGIVRNSRTQGDLLPEDLAVVAEEKEESGPGEGMKDASSEQAQLLKRMLHEIEMLKKKVEGSVSHTSSLQAEAADHSALVATPTSACAQLNEQAKADEGQTHLRTVQANSQEARRALNPDI